MQHCYFKGKLIYKKRLSRRTVGIVDSSILLLLLLLIGISRFHSIANPILIISNRTIV